MSQRVLIDPTAFALITERLCHELIENYGDFQDAVLIGVQPRGVRLANELTDHLRTTDRLGDLATGKLDITFYRDDFRRTSNPLRPDETTIPGSLEDKRVILVDDVLYTGRTIRAALDALLDHGRPASVELLVLIDRRLHRHVPVEAQYVGRVVDSIDEERVTVHWADHGAHEVTIQDKRTE